ncbi:helix-turn-helix domain-containing protein [Streptomyces dangxiongensis]
MRPLRHRHQTYSRIEHRHSSPKLDTLIRIADAIGVQLVQSVDEPPPRWG